MRIGPNKRRSSAYIEFGEFLIMINRSGPRIEPCGVLDNTGTRLEASPPTTTLWVRA